MAGLTAVLDERMRWRRSRLLEVMLDYKFDPELAALVPMLPKTSEDLAATRAQMAELIEAMNANVDVTGLSVEDRTVPGSEAAPQVPTRIYKPEQRPNPTAAVIYIHGGGFILGNLESEHGAAARLAIELGVVVVSVGYRLAPEHPFPAAVEDCYAVLQWVDAAANELNIDPQRIGVIGNSAGGGLAAAIAMMARDRKGATPCFQFLGMPELDDRMDTLSMQRFVDTPLFSRPQAERSWRHYLGEHTGEVSPYAAPARATDLSRLPPAFISVMEFDPLRDEGIAYGLKLLQAGVAVEMHTYPGTFHGSPAIMFAEISRRQAAEQLDVLRRALHCGVE